MRYILIAILSLSLIGCGGVRLPDNYSLILDKAAETNELILEKSEDKTDKEKAEIFEQVILEDIKTLEAAAETIRKGGGS